MARRVTGKAKEFAFHFAILALVFWGVGIMINLALKAWGIG